MAIVELENVKSKFESRDSPGRQDYLDLIDTLAATPDISGKAPLASPTFTGTVSGIDKTMVGLSNVDNTTDALKPVSTATQTALNLKAPLASPTFTGTLDFSGAIVTGITLADSSITSAKIADGTIVNADINASAAIDKTKISGTAVTVADTGTVTSTMLLDGTILNADINASAAIDWTKLGISSTVSSTEIGYVDGVTSAIQTQLDAKAPLASPTFTGTVSAAALTLSGDLTVNGTTTTINSTTLTIDDKNIILGDVTTPSDVTADGGGITLKGASDKTFNWVDATDAWTSSEHINLASEKTLKYNGTDLVAAQSGNSGKYLTTDGTVTSWAAVTIPSADNDQPILASQIFG